MLAGQACQFGGAGQLMDVLDKAVRLQAVEDVTTGVKSGLEALIERRQVTLPDEIRRPQDGSYARRLLFRSPDLGYEVIAMVWGPGQGTPLHDHAGIWCVDGVLEGRIAVTQFDLVEMKQDRYRFEEQQTVEAGVGMAGSLIPPFEYHTIRNLSSHESSITIHVYGGSLECCSVFEADENGWYERHQKQLSYS